MPMNANRLARAHEAAPDLQPAQEEARVPNVAVAQSARSFAAGRTNGNVRLTAAPGERGRRLRAQGEAFGAGADQSEEAKNVYRLSEAPPDVVAPVSAAQAVAPSRSPRALQSNAMAVVEIVSAIAGAAMTRILDNKGDVSWELDQMPNSAFHPGAAAASPSTAQWQSKTLTVPGFRCENNAGQETYADFEVTYKYNGASVGYVEVSTTKVGDAWGWALEVKETMTSDPIVYDTTPPTGQRFAAVKLRFHFRFDHSPFEDIIGIMDVTLYGNGAFAENSRWTQP